MNKALLLLWVLIIAGGVFAWKHEAVNLSADISRIAANAVSGTPTSVSATTTAATSSVESPATTVSPAPSVPAPSILVLNQNIYQGDTIFISFTNGSPTAAAFNGNPMHIFKFGGTEHAIYPVSDIFAPGAYKISANFAGGQTAEKIVQVQDFIFPVYQMGQPGGTPSPEVQAQLDSQAADFNSTFTGPDDLTAFAKTFLPPLHTTLKITSPYGEVREYVGGGAARHLGIDFAAPVGTPVYAVNDGTVVKVRNYLSYGNTIIIDHGAGIYSIYLHLSKAEVKEGDRISRNQEIGLSGSTGFETGPHLHLSLKIGGVSVDPMRFISTVK
jgi:murein DD-endopeptidase MepM/ murein hydrolase activator NlpD